MSVPPADPAFVRAIFLLTARKTALLIPLPELTSGVERLRQALAGRDTMPAPLSPWLAAIGDAAAQASALREAIAIFEAAIRRRSH